VLRKKVKLTRDEKKGISMTGSLATGFHEGSRSEYLAQFVFSSFGTAIRSHIRKTPELISIALCLSKRESELGHVRITQCK